MKLNRVAVVAALVLSVIFTVSCGETFRPVATPVFSGGGDPQNLRYAVVISENTTNNTVVGLGTQINVSGDTVASQVSLGRGSNHAALIGSTLFTANSLETSSTKYIPSFALTFAPTTTTLSGNPVFMYNSGINIYAALKNSGLVAVIDPSTGVQNSNTINVGGRPVAISGTPDGTKIYVVNQATNSVNVINSDGTTGPIIQVGSSPCCIIRHSLGTHFYVLNSGSNSVSLIDASTNSVTTIPVGTNPTFGVFDPNSFKLYVANTGSNSVSVISGAVAQAPVTVAGPPVSIAPLADGTRYYVSYANSKTVSVMSALNNTQLRTITVGPADTTTTQMQGNQTFYAAASPDSSKVYVANLSTIKDLTTNVISTVGNVSVIRTSDDTVVATATLPTGQVPKFILVTP